MSQFRIDLAKPASRFFLLAVVLSVAGTLAFCGVKFWFASHWDSSLQPSRWLKAARIEPDNPSYWEHTGLYELWDLQKGDAQQAAVYLRRATEIDPHSDKLWLELASAYEILGDRFPAGQAYQRAQQAHPISAEVAWRYGSFLLRQGDLSSGFTQVRRALTVEPSLTASAISECWRASPNIDMILNVALPAGLDYYVTAINFFLAQSQVDAALAVWNRLLARNERINVSQALSLINALIDRNRIPEAKKTWEQTLVLANWPDTKNENGSLVFNGGFEQELVDGGFDWRKGSISGVSFQIDAAVFHTGKHSMRITFDGSENFNFTHLLQYVPVVGGQRYHFSAYLRTEAITTDSGLRFYIYDPFHPTGVQVLTPNMTGTNPWSPVTAELLVANDTDLLVIALRRIPSWKFDNKLSGTAWVDDVALVPLRQLPQSGFQ